MVLVPRVRHRSVVKPLHRPQSHVCILGVPRLQLFVGGVVGVGELREVASHLWMADLHGG